VAGGVARGNRDELTWWIRSRGIFCKRANRWNRGWRSVQCRLWEI